MSTLWTIQRFSYKWRADGNHRDLKLMETWWHCRIRISYEREDIYFTAVDAAGKPIFERESTGFCGYALITTRRRWIEWPTIRDEQNDGSYILCTLEAGI